MTSDSSLTKFKQSYVFLFFLWPFFSVITATLSKNRNVFVYAWTFFFAFYGFTFLFPEMSDAGHFKNDFVEIYEQIHFGGMTIVGVWDNLYVEYPDPYTPFASYFIAQFTDDHRFLFAIFGGVLGYFFASNLFLTIENRRKLVGRHILIFSFFSIMVMAFLVPIWEINGMRMWTGCHFFVYHLFQYHSTQKRKHFVLYHFAFLFHHSFMMAFAFTFFQRFYKLVPLGLRMIILISLVSLKFIDFKYSPNFELMEGDGTIARKFNAYNNEKYVKGFLEKDEQKNINSTSSLSWFVVLNSKYIRQIPGLLAFSLVFIIWKLRRFEEFKESKVLNVIIAFATLAYLVSIHPSPTASRFIKVAGVLVVLGIMQLLGDFNKLAQIRIPTLGFIYFIWVTLFIFVVQTRFGFESFNSALFYGNPIIAWVQEDPKPLIDVYHDIFGVYSQ